MDKEITYEGVSYPSLRSLCDAYLVPYSTIRARIRRGLSLNDAINGYKRRPRKSIVVDGVTYPSMLQASNALGLRPSTLATRVRKGRISFGKDYCGVFVTCNGITYSSMSSLCRAYNIPRSTVYSRLNKGWTIEEAVKKRGLE